MRVRLETTVEELEQRGEDLIRALADQLEPFAPGLSEQLIKAVRNPKSDADDNLQFPALQGMKDVTTAEYERQLAGMLADISKVLDGRTLRKAFGDAGGEDEEEEDEGEPEEPLEPGDYDPKTDSIVPEPEDEEEEEEGEEEEKSMRHVTAGKAGIYIPTT